MVLTGQHSCCPFSIYERCCYTLFMFSQPSAGDLKKDEGQLKTHIPEVGIVIFAFEEGMVKIVREHAGPLGINVDVEVDVPRLVERIHAYEVIFEHDEKAYDRIAARTTMPQAPVLRSYLERFIVDAPRYVAEAGILPAGFQEREFPFLPLNIEYNPEGKEEPKISMSDSLQRELSSAVEEVGEALHLTKRKGAIHLGGRYVRFLAALLADIGVSVETNVMASPASALEMSVVNTIELALLHAFAHDYGHHIYAVYRPEDPLVQDSWFERAHQRFPSPWDMKGLEAREQDVFAERIAQSIAHLCCAALLREKGYDAQKIPAVLQCLGREWKEKVAQGGILDHWAHAHKTTLAYCEAALVRARVLLREKGHVKEAQRLSIPWREFGYHFPAFTVEELRYIIKGDN